MTTATANPSVIDEAVATATATAAAPEIFDIAATERDGSLNPRQVRASGQIPGTVYGKGFTPRNVQIDNHTFKLAYHRGVRTFKLGSLGLTARAHQVQYNPVSFQILNIEFLVQQ